MKYEIVIFDADETLFDFKKSERDALEKTMLEFNIDYDESRHLTIYQGINSVIWRELENGLITQEELKIERFKRLALSLGANFNVAQFAAAYLRHLSRASFLYEDAVRLIEELHGKFRLGIITNGLKDVQHHRIRQSIIGKYFEDIVISEEVQLSKPDPGIFQLFCNRIRYTDKERVLMVGDSLTSDIQGGINFGIDTCWFNQDRKINQTKIRPTYEISSLMQLRDILGG